MLSAYCVHCDVLRADIAENKHVCPCHHSATILVELTENEPTKKLQIVTMGERILAECQSRRCVGAKVSRHKPSLHEDMSLELAAEG